MLNGDAPENVVELLRRSVDAIAPRAGDYARVRASRFLSPGYSADELAKMVGLGWTGICVPAERGGSGLGRTALVALAEELGRRLSAEPVLEIACCASCLPDPWLARVIEGDAVVLPCLPGETAGLAPDEAVVLEGGRISGRVCNVPSAARAAALVVATAAGGLVLVQTDAAGIERETVVRQDGGTFDHIRFDRVSALPLAGDAEELRDNLALATAGYLLGVLTRAFEMSVDYLKIRQQFGRPIGSNQVLQHRAVDMKIHMELARAVVTAAARVADAEETTPAQRQARISRAKARAGDSAMFITRQAVQIHGGIGYTDEADPGLFLRKAMVLLNLYGSPESHRRRFDMIQPMGGPAAADR